MNNPSAAVIAPDCPNATGIAPPGVNYVQSFLNNASHYDGHTFLPTDYLL